MNNGRLRILIVHSTGITQERVAMLQRQRSPVEFIAVSDTKKEIFDALEGVNAMIGCPRSFFGAELLQKASPSLQWVHVNGAGCEEFLIPELIQSTIVLTNGRVIQGPEVADHALALLLTLTRNIHYVLRGSTEGMPRPLELRGKIATVVGVGGIGMLIAERLRACGMRVWGIDDQYVPMIQAIEQQYLPSAWEHALSQSEVVVNATPVTPRTRKMFGQREFMAMKRSCFFVNVSRGVIVDTEALVQALRTGTIAAAGLDVTDPEPLSADHPLRVMPNVVITPHIAGPSDHNRERSLVLIEQNIERFISGQPLLNIVDKQLHY